MNSGSISKNDISSGATIAALATSPTPSGLAVIRVSGKDCKAILPRIFSAKKSPADFPRELIYGRIIDHKNAETIDHALVVFMPNPHSFTGEDTIEIQFHGSPLIAQKILAELFSCGAEAAEPGEFTKRAFLNGKLDLVQAEAIADLINAGSERALKIASEQLNGRFSSALNDLGEPLRDVLAEIEASIDFPEEDIEPEKVDDLKSKLVAAGKNIKLLLDTYNYGSVLKEGFRVLLCGAPNVGKSSLLNLLLGKDRAIVTDISGTTRDLIEDEANIRGFKFIFCDSAGITETKDRVEKIGIELAFEKLEWADLVILVADAGDKAQDWETVLNQIKNKAKQIWMVTNKIDLEPGAIGVLYCESTFCPQNFYISVKTRAGVDSLLNALVDEVKSNLPGLSESNTVITNERHKICLQRAHGSLDIAVNNINHKQPLEIISADIRMALKSLEEIVGETHTEDILGRIFSKFCIGK